MRKPKDHFANKVMLSDISVGGIFNTGSMRFIVLEHTPEGTLCIQKNLHAVSMAFDNDSNNFAKSDIKNYLNSTYYKALVTDVGCDGIVEHEVDLLSADGLDTYGKDKCKISLPTLDIYRKYRRLMNLEGNYYWMATPWSTSDGYSNRRVCFVDSDGGLYYGGYGNGCGVRPFCILKSSIFVSDEN